MKIKANLILPTAKELQHMTGLDKGGKVQKYVDGFIFDRSEPYLPGYHLYRESKVANHYGSGQVIWNTPDANNLYEGKLMVDPVYKVGAFPIRGGKISFDEKDGTIEGYVSRRNVQKVIDPKKRDLNYHGGGLRNKKWFDRMIEDKMDELVQNVQHIVDGGK